MAQLCGDPVQFNHIMFHDVFMSDGMFMTNHFGSESNETMQKVVASIVKVWRIFSNLF